MFSSQIDINLITPTGTLQNGLMAEDMLRLVQRGSSSEPVELTGLVQALHHTADDFQISASDQLHPTPHVFDVVNWTLVEWKKQRHFF